MWLGGVVLDFSRKRTVGFGSGGREALEQDLAQLFLPAGPPGKSSVAGKSAPSAATDAVMAGAGRASHGKLWEQPWSSQSAPRGVPGQPSDS